MTSPTNLFLLRDQLPKWGRWCDIIVQPHGKHIPTNGDARVSLQGCLSISPWSALFHCLSLAALLCFVPGVFATQSSWLSRDLVFPNSHRFCLCHHLHLASAKAQCFIVDSTVSVFMSCQSSATFGATPVSTS